MAADTSGNVYVLEEYNNVVRRIDRLTSIVTTVVGNGGGGFSGDGGPATDAHLERPAGLCLDKAGNIYIADKGNGRIRKVDAATGIINTIAGTGITGYSGDGGAAIGAKLSGPRSVSTDNSGNIYIADYGNNRIRRVDAITGTITTIAGTGTASFSGDNGPAVAAGLAQPNCVFSSKTGVIYISDYGNNRIRAITTDGNIHTVAGSGLYGYLGDGGPAISATFLGPTGVCTDDSENIYISDFGNSTIRKVSPVYNAVTDVFFDQTIDIFPNPTTGIFRITTGEGWDQVTIAVINTIGRQVKTITTRGNAITIDLSDQPAGLYYLRIYSGASAITKKIVVCP